MEKEVLQKCSLKCMSLFPDEKPHGEVAASLNFLNFQSGSGG